MRSVPEGHFIAADPSVPKLIAIGLLVSLPLAAVAAMPPKGVVLVLAGICGLAGLGFLTTVTDRVIPAVLYIGLLASVSIPIDKYLFYQEHVGGWPGIRIAGADLFLFALIPIAIVGRYTGVVRRRIPAMVVVIYALLMIQYLVSSLGASFRDLAVFEVFSAAHALVLALVCAALFKREYITPILVLLAAQVLLHTSFATIQVATGRPIGVGLGASPADVVMEHFETGSARLRPSGLFDHPIVYANFLMIGLPILSAGALIAKSRLLRLVMISSTLIALMGLGLTLSRGAWVSTAVTCAVFVLLSRSKSLLTRRQLVGILLVAMIASILVGGVLGPRIIERLTASQAGNVEVRFELNWIALRMIAAHPIAGVGLNNFIETMEAYDPDDVMEYFPATVHNLYLLEASEAGLPALFLVFSLVIALFFTAYARLRRIEDTDCGWFAIAILAGLSGFAFSQIADFSHRMEPLRSVLWVNVGLLFGALDAARHRSSSPSERKQHVS